MIADDVGDGRACADGSQGEDKSHVHEKETYAWLHQAAKGVEADLVEIDNLTEMHSAAQGIAQKHDNTTAATDHTHTAKSAAACCSDSFKSSPKLKSPRPSVATKCDSIPNASVGSDDASLVASSSSLECVHTANSDSDDDIICLTKQQYCQRQLLEPGGGRSHSAFALATTTASLPAFTGTVPSFHSARAELDVRKQRRRERQIMRQRYVEQRVKVERLTAGAPTAARHSQLGGECEAAATGGCDARYEGEGSNAACKMVREEPGGSQSAAQKAKCNGAHVPAYLLKRQLSAAKQRTAPGHSSLDDERHCTHSWRRSAAALRAAHNVECGYDFLDRIEERAADHYSFVQRTQAFGREREARAERARQEQEYAALLDVDKRRCPRCGMVQSLDELQQRKKHCNRCGPGVLYARLPRGFDWARRSLQRKCASRADEQQRTADDGRGEPKMEGLTPSLVEQVFRNDHSPAAEKQRVMEATAAAAGGGAFLQRQKVDEMQREIADTECNVATSSANTRTRTRAMRRLDAVLAMRRTGETPSQPAEPGSFVERCRMEQLRTGLLVEPNSPEEEEAARRYAEMRVKQETKRSIQRGARHKAMQAVLARRRETYQIRHKQRCARKYAQHVERRRAFQQRKSQDPQCTFRPDCSASRQMLSISFSTFANTTDGHSHGKCNTRVFGGSVREGHNFHPSESF